MIGPGLPVCRPCILISCDTPSRPSWLAEGGNENELMLVAGWKSRIMIDRYTKATAVERARASHARLSPGDRL
jgi:hypothetical protein